MDSQIGPDDAVLARFGVWTVTTYDAVGRPVRVDLPNGTYAMTAHGAWATTAATPGDTVLESSYRVVREGRPVDNAERWPTSTRPGTRGRRR